MARKLPPWSDADRETMAAVIHDTADGLCTALQQDPGPSPDHFWQDFRMRVEDRATVIAHETVRSGAPGALLRLEPGDAAFLGARYATIALDLVEWIAGADRSDPRAFYAAVHELACACLWYRVAYPLRQGLRLELPGLDRGPFVVEVAHIVFPDGRTGFGPMVPDEDPAVVRAARRRYLVDAIHEEHAHPKGGKLTMDARLTMASARMVEDDCLTDAHIDTLENVLAHLTDSYRLWATEAGRVELMSQLRAQARLAATKILRHRPDHPERATLAKVVTMADEDMTPWICNGVHKLRMQEKL